MKRTAECISDTLGGGGGGTLGTKTPAIDSSYGSHIKAAVMVYTTFLFHALLSSPFLQLLWSPAVYTHDKFLTNSSNRWAILATWSTNKHFTWEPVSKTDSFPARAINRSRAIPVSWNRTAILEIHFVARVWIPWLIWLMWRSINRWLCLLFWGRLLRGR